MTSLAGSFLVARPVLDDPNFNQTVVLLLQHNPEGAFGLVVNRPVQVEGFNVPIFLGGPCEMPGMFLLHGYAEWFQEGENPVGHVAPGIFLGDEAIMVRLREVGEEYPDFRIFSGYSGWGPNQLEGELEAGAWAIVPANGPRLFDTPVADLWRRLLPVPIPQPSMN